MNLVLAPFLAGVVLVEAREVAIIAFVQRLVAAQRQIALAELVEHQLHRVLGAGQRRGESAVEGQAHRLEAGSGSLGLVHALFGEVGVFPAGEQILQIPFALAVTDEHKQTFGHFFS